MRPVIARLHARQHGAVDMEGAVEVDVDDPVPFLEFILIERSVLAGNARRIDEDIDAPERRLGLLHRRFDGGVAGDIDLDRGRRLAEFGHRRLE